MSIEEGLQSIFGAILEKARDERNAAFESQANNPLVEEARARLKKYDFEMFSYKFQRPLQGFAEGVIESVFGDNHRLVFLFQHSDFVSGHLRELFQSIEGNFACADRTRTVFRAIARHLKDGTPIQFDYSAEYTYQLPQYILKTEAEVMNFFEGLYSLYYGKPSKFLQETLVIHTVAKQRKEAAKADANG